MFDNFILLPILITALTIGIMAIFVVPLIMRSSQDRKLLQTGAPAQATILGIWDTGLTVNDNPQIGMHLEVRPANGEPFQAQVKKIVSRIQISQFQPGATLEVRYDPNDRTKVAVAAIGGGQMIAGMPMNNMQAQGYAMQMQNVLLGQEAANQEIVANGVAATATILQAWPMGVMVNGSNPAMGFKLEVHPGERPPFQAETKGVISQVSVAKFQPGHVIKVKYDPYDTSKVAIVGSL